MKNVLVTGGAGYIGSHVARVLMPEGYQVVILDDLSTGDRMLVPPGTTLVSGNIADRALVGDLIRNYGIRDIFHLAAFVDVEESQREPEKYFENNALNTLRLLRAARSAGVERFVFSSTAAVYGNPDQMPVSESARPDPVSYYGKSKLLAEDFVASSGMEYAILRYFNVAGGGYTGGTHTHLTRRAAQAALGDLDTFVVFGTDYPTPDGSAIRDLVHVKDLAQAHFDVLAYLERGGKSDIFNIGYGKGYSVLEVVNATGMIRGAPLKVAHAGRRDGDIMTMVAANQKFIRATGWQPKHASLDEILSDEIDWINAQNSSHQ